MDTSIHCGIFVLDATEANDKPELLLRKTKTLMNEKSTSFSNFEGISFIGINGYV